MSKAFSPGQQHWSDMEHGKLIASIEKLVTGTQSLHEREQEAQSQEPPHLRVQFNRLRSDELAELRLFAEAVRGRDAIGIVSLGSAFWLKKNSTLRQKIRAEASVLTQDERESCIAKLATLQNMNRRRVASFSTNNMAADESADPSSVAAHIEALSRSDYASLGLLSMTLQLKVAQLEKEIYEKTRAPTVSELLLKTSEGGDISPVLQIAHHNLNEFRQQAEFLKEQLGMLMDDKNYRFDMAQMEDGATRPTASEQHDAEQRLVEQLEGTPTDTWHLLRLRPYRTVVGESVQSIATKFDVDPSCIILHRELDGVSVDAPLDPGTNVLVRISQPLSRLNSSIDSLKRRIKVIEEATIPFCSSELVSAKQRLWDAEVAHMSEREHEKHNAENARNARSAVQSAQNNLDRVNETLRQAKEHLFSLAAGDLSAVSYMLEAKHLETLDGLSAGDRVVYTCRELRNGESIESFVSDVDCSPHEIVLFEDPATEATMAYVPTLVPRVSITKLDRELCDEISEFARRYPTLPPRTELHEQLTALRRGDTQTLCAMITSLRRAGGAGSDTIDEVRAKAAIDRQQLEKLHINNQQLSNQLADMAQELSNTKQKLEEYSREEAAERHLHVLEKSDFEAQNRILQRRLDDLAADHTTQGEQLQRLLRSSAPMEHETMQQRTTALEAQLQAERQRTEQLTSDIHMVRAELKAAEGELKRMKSQCDLSAAQLDYKSQELETVQSKARTEIAAVSAERTALQSELAQLRPVVQQKEHKISTLLDMIDKLRMQLDDSKNKLMLEQTSPARHRQQPRSGDTSPTSASDSQEPSLQFQLAAAEHRIRQLQQELLKTQRVIFVCREMPPGSSIDEFANGLSVPKQDLVVLSDPSTSRQLVYIPTVVPKSSVAGEDARLQSLIAKASGKQLVALKEQLAALRAGDCAAMSAMIPDGVQRPTNYRPCSVEVQTNAEEPSASEKQELGKSEDEDDKEEWWNAEVLRQKIDLLQEELQRAKAREAEWRRLCDDYRDHSRIRQAQIALEHAKVDFEKRLKARQNEIETLETEADRLKNQLEGAEKKRVSEAAKFQAAQGKWVADREELLSHFKEQLEEERQAHSRAQRKLHGEITSKEKQIQELSTLLESLKEEGEEED